MVLRGLEGLWKPSGESICHSEKGLKIDLRNF